jgi:hypothetical protein
VVRLFFDVVRAKDFWRYFWRLEKLRKKWPEDHLLDPLSSGYEVAGPPHHHHIITSMQDSIPA